MLLATRAASSATHIVSHFIRPAQQLQTLQPLFSLQAAAVELAARARATAAPGAGSEWFLSQTQRRCCSGSCHGLPQGSRAAAGLLLPGLHILSCQHRSCMRPAFHSRNPVVWCACNARHLLLGLATQLDFLPAKLVVSLVGCMHQLVACIE